jgi:hypothetical protein
MSDRSYLLDDEGIRKFIVEGYTLIETDFPPEFHEAVYRQIETVFENGGNPGNAILAKVPALQEVYDHPAVRGALTSILGQHYVMHPHRHCHVNAPGSGGGVWHQDDVNVRHHRIWRLLAMYYPQDVTEEMGPTVILPGTQYHNMPTTRMRSYTNFKSQLPLCVRAGTVAITHYDVWHGNMANRSTKKRFMLKFIFDRTEEPRGPAWNADPALRASMKTRLTMSGLPIDDGSSAYKHKAMWLAIWNWLYGERVETEETVITHYP